MSILSQVRAVRAVLATGLAVRAAAWGALASLTLIIGAALADLRTPLSLGTRSILLAASIAAGVATAAALAWRDRRVLSLRRVALWLEERFPSLAFTLATAVETGDERVVARDGVRQWRVTAVTRAARVVWPPLASLVAATTIVLTLPAGAVARVRSPHHGDSLDRPGGGGRAGASRLVPLVADIVPPAYSGQPSTTLDEPSDVRALVGSMVTLRGRGSGAGIVARRGADSIAAVSENDRWSISFRVDARAVALRIVDRRFQRIVAVEPAADAPPVVTLLSPAHDSVLRAAAGHIALSADVADDFGIASAAFEYIVSSGEGETFTFRSGTLGAARPSARRASIGASLALESLELHPGDVVHLRAVARDANDVSGPGIGASETRTIRIARRDEYDSVAVEAAAPSDADKSVISERILIVLAETLDKARPTLARDSLVSESRSIATDQKRLRRTVGEIVFTRLGGASGEEHTGEDSPARAKSMQDMLARADSATNRSIDPIDFGGGESPVVAVNTPLLEAYNAMWDASTELEIAEPGRALPHMRRALAAIQRARAAERVYLRGRPPDVIVDVGKARLQGKDKGASSMRQPTGKSDSAVVRRAERFTYVVELATRDTRAAIDSLLVLRIDALTGAPAFAAALRDAADAMRRGQSAAATEALVRARRSLAGAPVTRDSLTRWGIVP